MTQRRIVIAAEGDDAALRKRAEQLAMRLDLSCVASADEAGDAMALVVTGDALELREPHASGTRSRSKSRGMTIDLTALDLRTGSGGLSRKQPIARAFGQKVITIVDATAGTGQDAALLAALGYQVTAIERSPVLHAMLEDGLERAMRTDAFRATIDDRLRFIGGDSIAILASMHPPPDAVYIDPMFPPKKRASALPRKDIQMLRKLIGDDPDAGELFAAARQAAQQRIVVKRPTHAPPLHDEPPLSFTGKLVRYDVYLLHRAVS
jgi:16S rRNA (guanine1516-N2)-methyltransferase